MPETDHSNDHNHHAELDDPVKLQVANLASLPALNALINSAYRGEVSKLGWTTEADLIGGQRTDQATLAELIREPGQVILVQYDQSEPVACVFLSKCTDHAYLGMLTVRPGEQGRGTGRKLLQQAESWVQTEWALDKIEMTVIRQRPELIAWYERRGYQLTGRTEKFPYGDMKFGEPKITGLEFLVLEKSLRQS